MTTLRPLAKPVVNIASSRTAGKPPRLDFLPLSKLRIDDTYQRSIERKGLVTIVRICNEFDWNRFAPLIVARIPGKDELYAIIDGQHRATAALLCGFDLAPCAVVNATALEQPAIFAAVNGNVTPVTIFQLFKAARAAKEQWALDVDKVCTGAGIVPLVYPKARREIKPFETMAIGTIRKLIIRHGIDEITAALKAMRSRPRADEPGSWGALAIEHALAEWRIGQGKRAAVIDAGDASPGTVAQRIRSLKDRGYTRFAIQAALNVKLSVIEDALRATS